MNTATAMIIPIDINSSNGSKGNPGLTITPKPQNMDSISHDQRMIQTHKNLLEERLKSGYYRYILESMTNMDIGVLVINLDEDIIYYNFRAKRIFRLNGQHVNVRLTAELLSQESGLDIKGLIQRLHISHLREIKSMIKQVSSEKLFHMDIAPIMDESNVILGYLCMMHDLSMEQVTTNKKSEFVSMVAHELMNPLTPMKEGISMVLNEVIGTVNQKQKLCLSVVYDEINRLQHLVDDLLDINRFDMGKIKVIRAGINLSKIIKDIIDTLEPKYQEKAIQIRVEIPDRIHNFYTDTDRLKQVLINMIDNALKYSPSRSVIIIKVEVTRTTVSIHVKDQGFGIQKQDVKKIFDRFSQLDYPEHVQNRHKGNGLGLSIVKEIVKLLRGKITVRSEYGKGSEFTVMLPKRKKERPNETLQSTYCR
jgi:signal transduction histidine kinase